MDLVTRTSIVVIAACELARVIELVIAHRHTERHRRTFERRQQLALETMADMNDTFKQVNDLP